MKKPPIRFFAMSVLSIGILVCLNTPLERAFSTLESMARVAGTHRDMKRIRDALSASLSRNGRLPANDQLFEWLGTRFPEDSRLRFPVDRWGNALRYERFPDRKGFSLTSSGADEIFDTTDDIH